jgi:hypothetical protein
MTKRTGSYLGGHTLAPRSWFGRSNRDPATWNTKAEREAQAKINEAKWGKQREKSPPEIAEDARRFNLLVQELRQEFDIRFPPVEKSADEIAEEERERKASRHYRPRLKWTPAWFQKNKG